MKVLLILLQERVWDKKKKSVLDRRVFEPLHQVKSCMLLKKRQASTTGNWPHKEGIILPVIEPCDTGGGNRSLRLSGVSLKSPAKIIWEFVYLFCNPEIDQ